MESWRLVWRRGVAPNLSHAALEALRRALAEDDPRLVQAATTTPPPLPSVQDYPCEAACLLGYAGWQGDGLTTVAEVEEYFGRLCFQADEAIGEPAGVRYLLNAYDEWPRDVMRAMLLPEVQRALDVVDGKAVT